MDNSSRPLSRKKKIVFIAIAIIIILLFCTLLYLGSIFWRSSKHHNKCPRMIGTAYQPDKDYGFIPKPNSIALLYLRGGKRVPVIFDQNGFRVPVTKYQINRQYKRGILFLGCSFTHGDGVPAEKTFAYLAAKELNIKDMNAGLPGGGLCQMIMRAREEIPKFKPQYVVVQYSSWLIRRSRRFYRPTDFGRTPGPYFYESNGKISIHPPVFITKNFDLPISKYSRKGLFAFTWNVGIPLFVHNDYYVMLTSIKRLTGILPKPAESREAIVHFAYKEIERVCHAHGAKMLILKLYMGIKPMPSYGVDNLGYSVVDTHEPLASRLPERTMQAWRKQYSFFLKGNPPRLVDIHPNAEAHRIIAKTIFDKILSI